MKFFKHLKILIPFELSSISNPDKNISKRNPKIAKPDMNSEVSTIPKIGPTVIP